MRGHGLFTLKKPIRAHPRPTTPRTVERDPLAPKTILRESGLRPQRRFSQSFLTDQNIADDIVKAAGLTRDDTVLEVGPGLGILTQRLVRQAGRVRAVEIDRGLAARLETEIRDEHLTVVQGDALDFDPLDLDWGAYKLVANLPYHLTSHLLMRFLYEIAPPAMAVVMVQREVAERIAAKEGELTYLSVAVQNVCDVETVRNVASGAFYPRPKVNSTVLRFTPRVDPELIAGEREFLKFVRAGFAQPRKRLANSLCQGLQIPRAAVEPLLDEIGLPDEIRAHELTIETWHDLAAAWQAHEAPLNAC